MDQAIVTNIRRLLTEGRLDEAKTALEQALKASPDDPLLVAHRAALSMEFGDAEASVRALTDAASHAARMGHAAAQAFAELWLGYLYNRMKRPQDAVTHFEASASLAPPTDDLCAALCQTYSGMGVLDKAKIWGARALGLRAAEGQCPEGSKVKRKRPRPFDPSARKRNVISFSLFGDDPFYQECAVTVARSAPGIFPEFSCWFYCSESVPVSVKDALGRATARVMTVKGQPGATEHPYSGLLWRFLPFDQKDVDLVLVRDVDSPFTLRERAAVDLWLESDHPFLAIRDHVHHTEPLMAGMWGGFAGMLPSLAPVMSRYRPPGNSKFVDQIFLRQFVWPRIRDAVLSVDSVYTLGESVDFPAAVSRPGWLPAGTGWRRHHIVAPGKS